MVRSDLLAYYASGENAQLVFPETYVLPPNRTFQRLTRSDLQHRYPEVAFLVFNISSPSSSGLELGFTAVYCSDHQSFHENRFLVTRLFKRASSIADPMYHEPGDISNRKGFDFNPKLRNITEAQRSTCNANAAAAMSRLDPFVISPPSDMAQICGPRLSLWRHGLRDPADSAVDFGRGARPQHRCFDPRLIRRRGCQ